MALWQPLRPHHTRSSSREGSAPPVGLLRVTGAMGGVCVAPRGACLCARGGHCHVPRAVLEGQLMEGLCPHLCPWLSPETRASLWVWGQDWFGSHTRALCARHSRHWMHFLGSGCPQDSEGPRNIPPATEGGWGLLLTWGRVPWMLC